MSREIPDLTTIERTNIATMTAMTAFWFFCLGACLGSFLNVIVYRLPRGVSLSRKRSCCPSCDQPIEMRDNIPILGWLKLRGRCRNCQWPIPVRYTLVELLVASQFAALLFVELFSGGANLPVREPEHWKGVVWTVWYLKYPDLMESYLFHCLLLYLSTAFVLIASDGHRATRSLLGFGVIAGVVWLAIEPRLHPLLGLSGWWGSLEWSHRGAALWCGVLGLTVGAGLGGLLGMTTPRDADVPTRSALVAVLSLCGLYLGWKAAVSTTVLALALHLVLRAAAVAVPWFRRVPLTASLFVGLHLQILFWRQLGSILYWPSHVQHWRYHAEIIALLIGVAIFLRERNPVSDSAPGSTPPLTGE